MFLRALIALLGIGALAAGGIALREAGDNELLRRDLDELQRRVTSLEQRTTRLEAARAEDERRADQVRLALDGLTEAVARLAVGDPDVSAAIDFAEGVLSPYAGWNLRAARAAIANKDLGLAQQHLQQAIAEARLEPAVRGVR